MGNKNNKGHLKTYLSPLGAWAFAFGCSIGWGAFVIPGDTFLPIAGPLGTILGLVIGCILMLVLAFNYQYMIGRCPDAGGAYSYARQAFGKDHGFLAGWFLILAYVVVFWGNATALPMIARYLLGDSFQWGFHYVLFGYDVYLGEILLSFGVMALAALICLRPRLAVGFQISFAHILIIGVGFCFLYALFKNNLTLASFAPAYAPGVNPGSGIFSIVSLAPWAFVGFEAISHSAGEFSFKNKRTFVIMAVALIAAVLSYGFMTLLSIVHVPHNYESWAEYLREIDYMEGINALPAFASVKSLMGETGIFLLGLAAFAAIVTGLIGFMTAASRLLYSISLDGMLPEPFSRVNDSGVPYYAIISILLISVPVPFLGRTAINWLIDVTTICVVIAYLYVSASTLYFARRENQTLAVTAGGAGLVISCVFAVAFLVPNILLIRTLSAESYLLIAIWAILGLFWFRQKYIKSQVNEKAPTIMVWIILLALIMYTSLVWVLQTASKVEVTTAENIERYYRMESLKATEDNPGSVKDYVQEQLEISNSTMRNSSFIQIGFIVFAMMIVFNIYNIMQKRAKQMEIEKLQAEESSRSKSIFLSNMSHDIRTPMNAIVGMTTIARDHIDDKETVEDCLKKINTSSKQLLGLINDVLDISKIESGKMTLNPNDMSLRQAMQTVYEIVLPQTEEKGQKLDMNIRDLICDQVSCDGVRLNQVLLNFLSNAIKFTPVGGSISLSMWQCPSSKGDSYVQTHFSVEDTGIGMSKEFQNKMFTEFEREDNLRVHKIQGTGLGLAISKYIVDAMEGEIDVSSQQGVGSSFHVIVDLEKGSIKEGMESPVPDTDVTELNLEGRRILLAEDNDINAEIAQMILGECGMEVEWAEDGKIAWEMFAGSEPGYYDAVLMDLRMPNMNGLESTVAIRGMDRPDAKKIPIIAMTADAFAEDAQRCLAAGMNAHLTKPIDIDQITAALLKYLNH